MPYTRFVEFETAVRHWINAVMPALHDAGALRRQCDEFWVEESPGVRARVCRERFVYEPVADAICVRVPQWQAVADAFGLESAFAPYRGRFVGAGYDLVEFSVSNLVLGMRPTDIDFTRPSDLRGVDERDFETKMRALERLIDAQSIETELCTPFWDFSVTGATQLEDGLLLEELSIVSLDESLQMGLIFGDLPNGRWFTLTNNNRWALYRRYSRPKETVEARPNIGGYNEPNYYGDPDRLLDILPLVSFGRARAGGTLRRLTFGWPFSVHGITYAGWSHPGLTDSPPPSRGAALLDRAQTEDLKQLWARVAAIPKPSVIDVASRRLRYTVERDRQDDRMLDLGIAIEALFLPQDDTERELSFRSALNGAIFLTNNQQERLQIFNALRAAYTARSTVAHGKLLGDLRREGAPVDIPALLSETEQIVRSTLRRRIDSPELQTIDWSERVFGALA